MYTLQSKQFCQKKKSFKHIWESKLLAQKKKKERKAHTDNGQIFSKFN